MERATKIGTKSLGQELGTRDQGPGTREQGTGTRDPGPGTRDQGPGTSLNLVWFGLVFVFIEQVKKGQFS